MLRMISVNTTRSLQGCAGERLRRSIMTMPGVKRVSIAYPNKVEVHYDLGDAEAGRLMTAIRALGMRA